MFEILHWLPVKYRVQDKMLLLTFKGLYGLALPYIADLLKPREPKRDLRSADQNLLEVPKTKYRTAGDRAFSIVWARVLEGTPAVIAILRIPRVFQGAAQNIFVSLWGFYETARALAGI